MHSGARRALLYGSAVPLLAALVWAGFVREVDPDLGTLLSSVDVQLRMATVMQEQQGGRPVAEREDLLRSAAAHLERCRRLQPDSPIVAEFDGYLHGLRGELALAADTYRRARALPGCSTDQRDTLVFNEARMRARNGERDVAIALLAAETARMQPRYQAQARIETAGWLLESGQAEAAQPHLDAALASDQPMAWLQAGRLLLGHDQPAAADRALQRARATLPIADYWLARLKLAAGDVDTSLGLLERAAKAVPAEVGRLLREESAVWQVLAEDARYQAVCAPGAATPGR